MRNTGAHSRSSLGASEPRLRRRPIRATSELGDVDSSGRSGPDLTHLIGFGILLRAALLIAIGSLTAQRPGRVKAPPSTMRLPAAALITSAR